MAARCVLPCIRFALQPNTTAAYFAHSSSSGAEGELMGAKCLLGREPADWRQEAAALLFVYAQEHNESVKRWKERREGRCATLFMCLQVGVCCSTSLYSAVISKLSVLITASTQNITFSTFSLSVKQLLSLPAIYSAHYLPLPVSHDVKSTPLNQLTLTVRLGAQILFSIRDCHGTSETSEEQH